MQYTVTVHKSQLELLKDLVDIVSQTELLVDGYINCLIETEIKREQFWTVLWGESGRGL